MRIISGKHKGRKLLPPQNLPARPTTDFAKTGLFNIINNRFDFEGLHVLDLYAGTGAIGLEFLSRGSTQVIFVETHFGSCKFIKDTIHKLNMPEGLVVSQDVLTYLENCSLKFNIVFADPPYADCNIVAIKQIIDDRGLIQPGGLLIIEHAKAMTVQSELLGADVRSYGGSSFAFFEY